MPGQIEGNDVVRVAQGFDLPGPIGEVKPDRMHENDRRLAAWARSHRVDGAGGRRVRRGHQSSLSQALGAQSSSTPRLVTRWVAVMEWPIGISIVTMSRGAKTNATAANIASESRIGHGVVEGQERACAPQGPQSRRWVARRRRRRLASHDAEALGYDHGELIKQELSRQARRLRVLSSDQQTVADDVGFEVGS